MMPMSHAIFSVVRPNPPRAVFVYQKTGATVLGVSYVQATLMSGLLCMSRTCHPGEANEKVRVVNNQYFRQTGRLQQALDRCDLLRRAGRLW